MSLPLPNLDDRDFRDLLEEAHRRIAATCPEWTDRTPHDPGMALVEVFAFLTDILLYRLNRLPERAYVAFLGLMGVRLRPPTAARVTLRITRTGGAETPITVPAGARVTTEGGGDAEAPVFSVLDGGTLPAGETELELTAYHAQAVDAELVGTGTGQPGQSVRVARAPIVAPLADGRDLLVGVEADGDELATDVPARRHDGRAFRLWHEVDSFAQLAPEEAAYVVDRATGTITFAPALDLAETGRAHPLAQVPPADRQIRVWYLHGGGGEGNVAADTLVTMKDPVAGVQVTNPQPATGGRAAESLAHALERGPQELHTLERAVTARDYEAVALAHGGTVARARAFTRAEVRPYAAPGSVEVALVPDVAAEARPGGRLPVEVLTEHQTDASADQVRAELDRRRPLGTTCVVTWARYKPVSVRARVVVRPEEDAGAVERRVVERLHHLLSPLPSGPNREGWAFGRTVRASDVYGVILDEPGVAYADGVRLVVDEVPDDDVARVAPDPSDERTWYAASGSTLFRTHNDGRGWEPVARFPEERLTAVVPHPRHPTRPAFPPRPGWVALVSDVSDGASVVRRSTDQGETWEVVARTEFGVDDVAWVPRDGQPFLLLASEAGLHEVDVAAGGVPVPVLVEESDTPAGLLGVTSWATVRGAVRVAVTSRTTRGVHVSDDAGRTGTFQPAGLEGQLLRPLAVHYGPAREDLWVGTVASGDDPGSGCFRLRDGEVGSEWQPVREGWRGGSCWAVTFTDDTVLAASHGAGVLRADLGAESPSWTPAELGSGLPLRDREQFLFQPVRTVESQPTTGVALAGGSLGVYRTETAGESWVTACEAAFTEAVTLPPTWLLCSGDHEVEVVGDDAT